MPLYSATICGIAVIATRRPDHHAAAVPSTTAASISSRLCRPGSAKVANTATSMPTPAQRMPVRAVRGELMRLRPMMNSSAARK